MQIRQQRLDFGTSSMAPYNPISLICESALIQLPETLDKIEDFAGFSLCTATDGSSKPFEHYSKMNMWLFTGTALFLSLVVRMISGSWLLALIAGLVVLSRGSLVTSALQADFNTLLEFVLSISILGWTYSIKTGRNIGCVLAIAGIAFISLFIPALSLTPLVIAFLLIAIFRLRTKFNARIKSSIMASQNLRRHLPFSNQLPSLVVTLLKNTKNFILSKTHLPTDLTSPDIKNRRRSYTSTLSTIDLPYSYRILENKQLTRLIFFFLTVFLLNQISLYFLSFYYSTMAVWLHSFSDNISIEMVQQYAGHLDFHFWASLAIFFSCLLFPPGDGFLGMFELTWLVFSSFLSIFLGILLANIPLISVTNLGSAYLAQSFKVGIIVWEPVMLALAIPASIHVTKNIATLAERYLYPNSEGGFWRPLAEGDDAQMTPQSILKKK